MAISLGIYPTFSDKPIHKDLNSCGVPRAMIKLLSQRSNSMEFQATSPTQIVLDTFPRQTTANSPWSFIHCWDLDYMWWPFITIIASSLYFLISNTIPYRHAKWIDQVLNQDFVWICLDCVWYESGRDNNNMITALTIQVSDSWGVWFQVPCEQDPALDSIFSMRTCPFRPHLWCTCSTPYDMVSEFLFAYMCITYIKTNHWRCCHYLQHHQGKNVISSTFCAAHCTPCSSHWSFGSVLSERACRPYYYIY